MLPVSRSGMSCRAQAFAGREAIQNGIALNAYGLVAFGVEGLTCGFQGLGLAGALGLTPKS